MGPAFREVEAYVEIQKESGFGMLEDLRQAVAEQARRDSMRDGGFSVLALQPSGTVGPVAVVISRIPIVISDGGKYACWTSR